MTFPGLAEFMDWSVTPKFLDTELQEIVRDSESGPMRVDKPFRQDVKEMEASMHMPRRSTYEQIVWEEGLEQGLEKGRDEGRVEGRVEGRIAGAQEVLVDLVAERFGGVGPGLRGRIESIVDGVRLRQLARAAVTVSSLSEFEQRIGK